MCITTITTGAHAHPATSTAGVLWCVRCAWARWGAPSRGVWTCGPSRCAAARATALPRRAGLAAAHPPWRARFWQPAVRSGPQAGRGMSRATVGTPRHHGATRSVATKGRGPAAARAIARARGGASPRGLPRAGPGARRAGAAPRRLGPARPLACVRLQGVSALCPTRAVSWWPHGPPGGNPRRPCCGRRSRARPPRPGRVTADGGQARSTMVTATPAGAWRPFAFEPTRPWTPRGGWSPSPGVTAHAAASRSAPHRSRAMATCSDGITQSRPARGGLERGRWGWRRALSRPCDNASGGQRTHRSALLLPAVVLGGHNTSPAPMGFWRLCNGSESHVCE